MSKTNGQSGEKRESVFLEFSQQQVKGALPVTDQMVKGSVVHNMTSNPNAQTSDSSSNLKNINAGEATKNS